MLQQVAVVIYKLEVVEVKVMGVACNELEVVVASTLHTVVEVEVVLYMEEVKVVVENELEEVGNK